MGDVEDGHGSLIERISREEAHLEELMSALDIQISIQDERTIGDALEVEFRGELTAEQSCASKALIAADTGIFVAPPGTGKTVLGIHLVAKRARSALILVHRTQLLDQWRAQLALFLDLPEKEIGQIGGGTAMIQS